MKRVFTIASIFIILVSFSAKAQVKSYIALYGGFSNPKGDYASTDYNNNKSGFAKRGVVAGIEGAVYLYKNLGIGYTLSFQDQGKLNYNDTYNLALGYNGSYNADATTVTSSNRYHNWNLLLGPQYSFEYHKFILDIRPSAGIIKVNSTPETSVFISGVPEQTAVFYQRSSSGIVFGYGGSAGLRYKLGDSWSVGIKGAYISSQGTKVNSTDGRTDDVGRMVTRLPITEFQTTIGINLQF